VLFTFQLIFSGLAIGAIYALIGNGLNVTWRALKVNNFGHGSFLMIAAMVALELHNRKAPLWVALLVGAIVTIVLSLILERVAIRPQMKQRKGHGWLVSTLGAGVLLQAIASELWGASAMAFPPVIFGPSDYIVIAGLKVSLQLLLVLVGSVIVMFGLEALIEHTRYGRAMKATAFDNEYAQLVGINAQFMVSLSFAMSGLLAAFAGFLIAPITGVDAGFGLHMLLKGFAATVIGGIGSSRGALIGGLTVGVLEQLVQGYVSSAAGNSIGFILMTVFLLTRPNGMFGKEALVKV
jgi:branched-chain amino acid transport system permease protein